MKKLTLILLVLVALTSCEKYDPGFNNEPPTVEDTPWSYVTVVDLQPRVKFNYSYPSNTLTVLSELNFSNENNIELKTKWVQGTPPTPGWSAWRQVYDYHLGHTDVDGDSITLRVSRAITQNVNTWYFVASYNTNYAGWFYDTLYPQQVGDSLVLDYKFYN